MTIVDNHKNTTQDITDSGSSATVTPATLSDTVKPETVQVVVFTIEPRDGSENIQLAIPVSALEDVVLEHLYKTGSIQDSLEKIQSCDDFFMETFRKTKALDDSYNRAYKDAQTEGERTRITELDELSWTTLCITVNRFVRNLKPDEQAQFLGTLLDCVSYQYEFTTVEKNSGGNLFWYEPYSEDLLTLEDTLSR